MKKKVLVLLFLFGVFFWLDVSYWTTNSFQDRLYCNVTDNSVSVYLMKEEWMLKCKDFISVLNDYLTEEYNVLIQVMINRNRWDDYEYWNNLYEVKKSKFLNLFLQRKSIQNAMNDFESDFLLKSQEFLEPSLLERKQVTEIQLLAVNKVLLDSAWNKEVKKAKETLEEKISVIDKMLLSQNMNEFIVYFSRYLTLFGYTSWK